MTVTQQDAIRSEVIKNHIQYYAAIGLFFAVTLLMVVSFIASYQLIGTIGFWGMIQAQKTNPVLWAFDSLIILMMYWGYQFCYTIAGSAEEVIEERTREFMSRSGDLESKLKYKDDYDNLTHLPNYHYLTQLIAQSIQKLNKDDGLAVLVLKINDFKDINYKYGSFGANSLLVQFSEILKSLLVEPCMLQNYMGMNIVARLQGSEFAILIPKLRKEHDFDSIIKTILEKATLNFVMDGKQSNVTATVGAAIYPIHGNTQELLLLHASVSLLYAERNNLPWALYDTAMYNPLKTTQHLVKELTEAVDQDTLKVKFIPIVDLSTGRIVSCEAVAGFGDLSSEFLTGDKLFPLIEEAGLDRKLTRSLVKRAIEQIASWNKVNVSLQVTVNILDLSDLELPNYIAQQLEANQVSASSLKLALSEKACLNQQNSSLTVLNQLSAIGLVLLISDFCSGYSSFVYLASFPINEVKIDNSFVLNLENDDKKLKILRAIIMLADMFNLPVSAEGIENLTTAKQLNQMGCKFGQGSYFSSEVTGSDLTDLLNKG